MKKLVFLLFIIILFGLISWNHSGQAEKENESDYQVIPDDAIRLRILANSDLDKDQQVKELVRDAVNEEITEWVAEITDIEAARKLIQQKLPEIEEIIHNIMKEHAANHDFTLDYASDITFPMKLYGDYLYPAGEYEAILVTLGEGKGTNWWCVLFPPLCFLDFSFGTTVDTTDTEEELEELEDPQEPQETEVKFFLFEWLGWS